ncbi:hypothetical protein ANANG_G00075780 [Anguilla anguilla]|uniref:Uncharacterized protein n=1 Tax=Anguilla anguilla TaxID=7936 RepID=A0A9D3S4F8_ANGAN|nr:hypothetical protein ANANG_G00075780 [Anguilla anguilla]
MGKFNVMKVKAFGSSTGGSCSEAPQVQPGLQLGQPANTTLGSTAAPRTLLQCLAPLLGVLALSPQVQPGLQLGQPANTTLGSTGDD